MLTKRISLDRIGEKVTEETRRNVKEQIVDTCRWKKRGKRLNSFGINRNNINNIVNLFNRYDIMTFDKYGTNRETFNKYIFPVDEYDYDYVWNKKIGWHIVRGRLLEEIRNENQYEKFKKVRRKYNLWRRRTYGKGRKNRRRTSIWNWVSSIRRIGRNVR